MTIKKQIFQVTIIPVLITILAFGCSDDNKKSSKSDSKTINISGNISGGSAIANENIDVTNDNDLILGSGTSDSSGNYSVEISENHSGSLTLSGASLSSHTPSLTGGLSTRILAYLKIMNVKADTNIININPITNAVWLKFSKQDSQNTDFESSSTSIMDAIGGGMKYTHFAKQQITPISGDTNAKPSVVAVLLESLGKFIKGNGNISEFLLATSDNPNATSLLEDDLFQVEVTSSFMANGYTPEKITEDFTQYTDGKAMVTIAKLGTLFESVNEEIVGLTDAEKKLVFDGVKSAIQSVVKSIKQSNSVTSISELGTNAFTNTVANTIKLSTEIIKKTVTENSVDENSQEQMIDYIGNEVGKNLVSSTVP
jgi:hypothetical protein